MKKVLGNNKNYHLQTNDGSYELLKDYKAKYKAIACGPNSFACGLEIGNWPSTPFGKGVQWADHILMVLHNPHNLKTLKAFREIDTDKYPPNEVPQFYPGVAEILYGTEGKAIQFGWNLTIDFVIQSINKKSTLMVGGNFLAGGHYVTLRGYDTIKRTIIFNDPYPSQWPDKDGNGRSMTYEWFEENLSKYYVLIPRYKG